MRGLETNALQESLLRGEYLSPDELKAAEALAKKKNITLVEAILELKLLTKDLVGQVSAEAFGVSFAEFDALPVDRAGIARIDEATARKHRAIYMREIKKTVEVASDMPSDELRASLSTLFTGKKLTLYYTLPEYVDIALKLYEKTLSSRFEELLNTQNASIPDIVSTIFDRAVDSHVSDIHFEPGVVDVGVRFRIDGVLLHIGSIPKMFYEKILNRIKVLAQLPIDEHMRTQDGSLRHERKEGVVNFRVSIAPTIGGEKIALRVLTSYRGFAVEELGLSDANRAILEKAAQKPFGMILTTGPTGSGKTTTLYAFLNTRNTPDVNITTIEDPVEYKIAGLNQMQVNPLTDLTFARGLRSIVRQDPDIVLVGEIRDKETAEIAVNAALTGRLLFSTFHSNDASTTIPRLIDMGIEPFLLSSTLELIVAQRLVRKICDSCRTSYSVSSRESNKLKRFQLTGGGTVKRTEITLFRGAGCQACQGTGYKGRIGIYELIQNTPAMQDLIVRKPNRTDIWSLAKAEGSRSLFDDGFEKVTEGVTSLEELYRVAEPATNA